MRPRFHRRPSAAERRKNISREALIRTVERPSSRPIDVSPLGYENVWVEVDAETGKIRVFRAMVAVAEVEIRCSSSRSRGPRAVKPGRRAR